MSFQHFTTWQIHDNTGRRKYINAGERQRVLAAADDLDAPERALCRVLVYTGCRISEALGLRIHQLDTLQMTVTIKTLKRRQTVFRVIPIPDDLVADLMALPVDRDGRFWRMHRTTAWRLVKRLMGESAIAGPMACCKGLRHGYGIRAAARGVPPNLIQRWMGHSSGSTTAIYIDAIGTEERGFAMKTW